MLYNVYCDETCHLEHDSSNVMVLGAVWCPQSKLKEINERIRQIKKRNNVSEAMEMDENQPCKSCEEKTGCGAEKGGKA